MSPASTSAAPKRFRKRLAGALAAGSRPLRVVITLAMLFLAVGAGMGLERFVTGESAIGSQQHDSLEDIDEYQTLADTYDLIRQNYVQSDEISDEELIWGASQGMIDALGDEGHSSFLNPTEAADYYETTSGEFVGIGVQIDTEVTPPRIILPIAGSPAQAAGIIQNDEILAIDGAPYSAFQDMDDFTDLIGGDEGTDVVLELRHFSDADSYEVTITRSRIIVDTVFWAMMPDNVMWVRISGFEEGTGDELEAALEDGIKAGAEGVILDLRANGGGLITEEIQVISNFIDQGSVITIREDSEGNETETVVEEETGLWREGPLVVLINGDSASAAEVTTAAIMDNDRGISIGETTFGTGTSLALVDLDDGSLVFIGVEMWLRPNGEAIWHVGLPPDIAIENEPGVPFALPYFFDDNEVTDDQFAELEDDQLLTAYEEIMNQLGDAGN